MASDLSRTEWFRVLSEYVKNALVERTQTRESALFSNLLQNLDGFTTQPAQHAKATVDALVQHASLLDHIAHEQLLTKLFGASFWELSAEVVEALCEFTVCLVSANSSCLLGCVDVLVGYFAAPPPAGLTHAEEGGKQASKHATQLAVLNLVHGALARVIDVVPSAPGLVQQVVLQHLPHKRVDKCSHQKFLHNLFRLAELPQALPIRDGLLLGVISRLLEIDVEIKYEELDELEDGVDEDIDGEALFDFEEAARSVEDVSLRESRPIDETADKLDGMMDIVFAHLGRRISGGDFDGTVQTLLRAFQLSLLQTYKSKFTQFLVFYVCTRDESMRAASAFCDLLFSKIADASQPPILRVAAASYVASFLARSSFLSPFFVVQRLVQLSSWCLAFLDRHEEAAASGDTAPQSQEVFDAVCQGLLYVLCYRMEMIADGGASALTQLRALPMERLLNHALQPLRACAPAIAHEYARRARALRMPGRSAARAAAAALFGTVGHNGNLAAARQTRPLDTFFPFDPYLLRHSAAQLELRRSYIRWQSSDANEQEAIEYDSDGRSTVSGLDERASLADDSYRELYGVAMHVGLARPAPLVAAMSYEDAVLSGSSFGGLSLQ